MKINERVSKVADSVFLTFFRKQESAIDVYNSIFEQLIQLAEDVRRESYNKGLEDGRNEFKAHPST